MVSVAVPIVFFVMLAALAVPAGIAYVLLRRRDPEHALRRTVGLGLMVVGAIALLIGGLALVSAAAGPGSMIEGEYTSHSSSSSSRNYILPGPDALSLWLLAAGAALAWGVSLFTRRFSLRSLLIGLVLLGLLASTPQFLVKPSFWRATLTVTADRALTDAEWTTLQQQLQKERLCAWLSEKVTTASAGPAQDAIREVEVVPLPANGAEASGVIGVRLALRFSSDLETDQVHEIFQALQEYLKSAVLERAPLEVDSSVEAAPSFKKSGQ